MNRLAVLVIGIPAIVVGWLVYALLWLLERLELLPEVSGE